MNILFIANLVPYPLDGGGKIKTFTTIKALSSKHTIDLVCFYEKENVKDAKKELSKYCRSIVMLPIRVTTSENKKYIVRKALECFLSTKSLSVHKYYQDNMARVVATLVKKNNYDIAYFNILQVYQYKSIIHRINPNIKTVLDTQNCEALIFKRNADDCRNPLKKVYLYLESIKLGRFEVKAIQDADELILLSKEDKRQLEKMAKKRLKATIIPIGVDEPGWVKKARIIDNTIKILFVGTLTWAPNNDGIIWFLENVIPQMVRKGISFELYVVGKNPSEELKRIAKRFEDKIVVTGYVDSVEEYYDMCDIMIVPLFFGSGQRVKIIEGFAHGMPIISTTVGAEGLMIKSGWNIMIANDEKTFIESIGELKSQKLRGRLSNNGKKTFAKYYSQEAIETQLNRVMIKMEDEKAGGIGFESDRN